MGKRGPEPLPPDKKKSKQLNAAMTPEEYESFLNATSKLDYRGPADTVRAVARAIKNKPDFVRLIGLYSNLSSEDIEKAES